MKDSEIQIYSASVNTASAFKRRMKAILPVLSLFVILTVFWWLKLTGITLAGEAFCGRDEHIHSDECIVKTLICTETTSGDLENDDKQQTTYSNAADSDETETISETITEIFETGSGETETEGTDSVKTEPKEDVPKETETKESVHVHTEECYEITYICGQEEHIHIPTCYSDVTADVETADDWEATLNGISPEISTADKMAAVAKSQLGYTESTVNFIVDSDGTRHGYTRYGEWYGNPYGDWSVMFTSFCLSYSGADAPISSGADAMRLMWIDEGLYRAAGNYTPLRGDVVFLDKNLNGTADATAIVTEVTADTVTVIEGDLEDKVSLAEYRRDDVLLSGYGVVSPQNHMMMMAAPTNTVTVGQTADYNTLNFSSSDEFIIYTVGSDGNYYAIDGNSKAVRIYIDDKGAITADTDDVSSLYWTFSYCGTYESRTTYYIQNISTRMYLHPYINSNTDRGAMLSGRWETALYPSGSGVKFRGARQNAYAMIQNNSAFTCVGTLNEGSTFYFGKAPTQCSVWFDGTNGGLMSLSGSPDISYSVAEGGSIILPTQWQSPDKYSYTLRGWYDIINRKYYVPGATVTVTENMVFYADWVASSYDIGQFNSDTANTTDTSDFVTIQMFDYGVLFNLLSESVSVDVSASGHTETWSLLTSGNNPYNGEPTLDFIFRDWDRGSEDISYPKNHNNKNNPTNAGSVYPNVYTDKLGELLFDTGNSFDPVTGSGVIGKQYLGTGNYLFQLMEDPSDEYYGYYYYDSARNAASYNQTNQRFYVYDYLECTSDSANSNDAIGRYSDFLPLNSPYVNTNGKEVPTYTYDGAHGEYVGTSHYMYDAKYSDSNNSPDRVGSNFWFGMSVDVNFYLPDSPGDVDEDGRFGNRDLYGKELHFKFSGDDDVWVFVDGELVLDLGGIHGAESGDINFSSGIVTVNGTEVRTIYDIEPGEHVLTIYYLERGSSRSNCAIYFNLVPRFALSIQKEDVLTQEILNGTQFSVYTDKECTVPAELWVSEEAYERKDPSTNVFTVSDGSADMWGLSAGTTYYIKETKPPDAEDYSTSRGIICLVLDKNGTASYSVELIEETDENGNPIDISNGFTVHGFRIDEETKQAFIAITNAQNWVIETTTVQAMKEWNDTEDHTYDSITVYLTVTDPDGTVRRIREIVLSEENGWTYTWTSLPKYAKDGVTEIVYGIEESYKAGYSPTIEKVDQLVDVKYEWAEAYTFENGKTYILGMSGGYLSAATPTGSTLAIVDEETAKNSPSALWTATVSSGKVRFTNGNGQILSFNYSLYSSSRYYYVTTSSTSYQTLTPVNTNSGISFYCTRSNSNYYIGSVGTNGRATATTSSGSAALFAPMTLTTKTTILEVEDLAFKITNTPLSEETSLKVTKIWDTGMSEDVDYEQSLVTVKLFANGKDTGRTVTLSLKNGWTDTFLGLPYRDSDGNVIVYSVEESWNTEDWIATYGDVITIDGDVPTYEVSVTNTYRWGHGYELPSTGGYGYVPMILCGAILAVGSLVYGYVFRRKRERRLH